MTRRGRSTLMGALLVVLHVTGAPAAMADHHVATLSDSAASFSGKTHKIVPGEAKADAAGGAPPSKPGAPRSAHISNVDVQGSSAPKEDIKVKTGACDNSIAECDSARAGCITLSGNPNYFDPPTITWISVNNGPWRSMGVTCGTPKSVTLPSAPGEPPRRVAIQAPPVPTFAQIQSAFRELPFSKPTVSVQPKGMRTLKGLKTFYAAEWPGDDGLQPGEVSKPMKLLSWTVEFKIAAQDYRYGFGDGTTSGWTTSVGGTYPDGDVTHTYKRTGDMSVKVDARLTGQYRVNGGDWQDIATVADLQDEPVDTLEVLGTRTRLTTGEG